MNGNGTPRVITLDAYAASHRAVRELKAEGKMPKRVRVRSSKYLNNGIEQDHRRVKQRIRPMLGFKRFHTAAGTISGIELAALALGTPVAGSFALRLPYQPCCAVLRHYPLAEIGKGLGRQG